MVGRPNDITALFRKADCQTYSKAEEVALAIRASKRDEDGNHTPDAMEARERLIMSCVPLAFAVMTKCVEWSGCKCSRMLDSRDLSSEALYSLIIAVDRFNYRLGFRLSTYAHIAISRNLLRYISYNRYCLKLPILKNDAYSDQIEVARRQTYDVYEPRVENGCARLQIHGESPLMIAAEREEAAMLEEAVCGLDEKRQEVLRRRLRGETLNMIGMSMGITRERVRQIGNRAQELVQLAVDEMRTRRTGLDCEAEAGSDTEKTEEEAREL